MNADKPARRALVYDDDEAFAEECAEALSRHGYEVATRNGNGRFAALLASVEPQLLLLDLHMPDFDGFEALRAIRDYKGKDTLTVIIVSAAEPSLLSMAETLAQPYGIRLGGILGKPVTLAALEKALASAGDDKSAQI